MLIAAAPKPLEALFAYFRTFLTALSLLLAPHATVNGANRTDGRLRRWIQMPRRKRPAAAASGTRPSSHFALPFPLCHRRAHARSSVLGRRATRAVRSDASMGQVSVCHPILPRNFFHILLSALQLYRTDEALPNSEAGGRRTFFILLPHLSDGKETASRRARQFSYL